MPSEWPTCAASDAESEVQSAHVRPTASVPSLFEPVRTSCSTGLGDPAHWPLIRSPRSFTSPLASPERACRSVRLLATSIMLALYQGPEPIRSRACVGWLLLAASRSTLR